MTQIEPEPDAKAIPHPYDLLMALIIALLAPMFLGVSAGNLGLARMAAMQTVNAYRSRNHADLIAVAQIVGFGLAALGSLSLSLADDVTIAMALRLRGNANALNRSAEQNRRALAKSQTNDTVAYQADPVPDLETFLSEEAMGELERESEARLRPPEPTSPVPPPQAAIPVPNKRYQEMWAIAMVKEAAEITASLPNLPLAEREPASIRAATLSKTANQLLYGTQTSTHSAAA